MTSTHAQLPDDTSFKEFSIKFLDFIGSDSNTALFDNTWFSLNTIDYQVSMKKSITSHTSKVYEFESSTLTLDLLKAEIIDSLPLDSSGNSDFGILRDALNANSDPGIIIIYRCSELSSNSVQLLSRLNAFLKESKSRWKIVYFGELGQVFPLHLKQLALDKIYTGIDRVNKTNKKVVNRKMFATLCVLITLSVFSFFYYWPNTLSDSSNVNVVAPIVVAPIEDISPNSSRLASGETQPKLTQNTHEDELENWAARVAEFDNAMSNFVNPSAPLKPLASNSEAHSRAVVSRYAATMSDELASAAKAGDLPLIDKLLSDGSNINAKSANQETLLILASSSGHLELATWLLKQGANVSSTDGDNGSALYYAAVNGHFEVAKTLLNNGANTAQVSKLNKTPLMAAVHNNYLELSSLLISANSNVDQQDHSGWSALYYAIWNGNLKMTMLLLDNGASAQLKDRDGYTPIDIAKARKDDEILKLL